MKYSIKVIFVFTTFLTIHINAQENEKVDTTYAELKEKVNELEGVIAGLNESYLETKSTVDALKKIKISGYVQTQFQSAENDGVSSFAGGNFGAGIHNRFMVRRGRIKFTYDNIITNFVLQIDATEKGLGLKDAYVYLTEPWLQTFKLKAGVFDRPFGFEISYSSGNRESPERSRLFQTLFPGERDLGASFEITPQEGVLSFFNFKGGFFAGNGVNPEVDNQKDFIGRFGFQIPFYEENLAIDGGISTYFGKVKKAAGKNLYLVNSDLTPQNKSAVNAADRNYLGLDLQIYYSLPVLGGFTLRGEYISGKQVGSSAASSTSPTGLFTGDLYQRNFMGYYLMYVQNIGEFNQFVLKYDQYDPNIDVEGNQIGLNAAAKLGTGDLKYSTLGIGLIHYWDDNIKFVFYYDLVANETSKYLPGYTENIKDDVFTIRIQYKF
jgi:phosphate-selective porin